MNFLWTNSLLSEVSGDLDDIAALGFDVLYSYRVTSASSDADVTAWLDALDAAGLKAMLTVRELGKNIVKDRPSKVLTAGELAALTTWVNKFKNHAACWGWYADDEGTAAEYPISTRQQVYDTIKAAHPAGQVFEVAYNIFDGAYSADVHDVFAIDIYPIQYDSAPGGSVDRVSGSVSSVTNIDAEVGWMRTALTSFATILDAAGETNYLCCMQAFRHSRLGVLHDKAMPPSSCIWRMWGAVRDAGWDSYGAGFFIWHSDPDYTLPVEQLYGVGGAEWSEQRAEIAAICAAPDPYDIEAFGAYPLAPIYAYDRGPRLPQYSVVIGAAGTVPSRDISELVDLDTLHRSMSERGEASATIDIPVASENEVPSNFFARDATVAIDVDGEREWLGHVVAVHKPQPQDLSYTLDCAGGWDTLHHCAPWCKGFVEARYEELVQVSAAAASLTSLLPSTAATMDTDGQLLLMFPKGGDMKALQGIAAGYWLFGGLDSDSQIGRVTFDWVTGGNTTSMYCVATLQEGLYDTGSAFAFFFENMQPPGSGSADFDVIELPGGSVLRTLVFMVQGEANVTLDADTFLQIRNLRIYVDRTTAPRVDEIVAAIDAEVRPDAPTALTGAIGAPLTAFMCDPFTTPAEGIAVALTKAAVPPLCGIFQNQLIIIARPTTPPDATRLWTVSEQTTPGLEWGVEVDEEQSVDYVGVAYNVIGDAGLPDGTPRIAYYPYAPSNAAERTALIDGGDLTAVEAGFYAEQGYHYLHNLASGPVTIPYVVRDANGNERPADVIRAWDWVQNVGLLDAERAGPFLVSEVEHQGHIATLNIGASEAYAYNGPDRMPTKGRYVGAHRVRTRTKQRVSFAKYWAWKHRKDKRKPKMPRRHAKYGTIRGWKWTDVEGRYT